MASELMSTEEVSLIENDERVFSLIQRKAKLYASSDLVPKEYRDNIANCVIAMNMADRLGADILQVMQNLYVVHGRPGWSAQFLIATFNSCGRFAPIQYRFTGTKGEDSWGCVAHTRSLGDDEILEGTEVTIALAKAEGWVSRTGSKWQTMPEQMLRYRSAAFLIRTIAPEVSMGLLTTEELRDTPDEIRDTKSLMIGDTPKVSDIDTTPQGVVNSQGEIIPLEDDFSDLDADWKSDCQDAFEVCEGIRDVDAQLKSMTFSDEREEAFAKNQAEARKAEIRGIRGG